MLFFVSVKKNNAPSFVICNPEGSNIRICNPQKTPLKKNTNKSELRTQNIYNFTQNFLTQTLI